MFYYILFVCLLLASGFLGLMFLAMKSVWESDQWYSTYLIAMWSLDSLMDSIEKVDICCTVRRIKCYLS